MRWILFLLIPLVSLGQSDYNRIQELLDAGDYAFAKAETKKVLSVNPNDTKAIELLGDAYAYLAQWESAIAEYEKLVAADDTVANYHYKLGGASAMYAKASSRFKALTLVPAIKRHLKRAAALDSKHIDTRWALVELYVSLPGIVGGSYSTAMDYADELYEISPVDGYLARGYVYQYDDEPALAEKNYKLAVATGGSVTCYEKLADYYEKTGQFNAAMTTYVEGCKKHERNAFNYQIGKVSAMYGIHLDQGIFYLELYLENYDATDGVEPEWVFYRLAQIYKHKGNVVAARHEINLALK